MKFFIELKKFLPAVGAVCSLFFFNQTAQASSSLNSTANLLYTINVIAQGPGSLTDLQITDSFEMAPSESEAILGVGTFTVTPNNLGLYNKQLTLVSNVQNGQAHLSETGWTGLNFLNNSSDTSYLIEATLDYGLSATTSVHVANGDFADTDILLNYYNKNSSFSGTDWVFSYANISTQLGTVQKNGSSGLFSFTLAPGESEDIFADIKITGNLEVAPVPIPGAIWLFGSALMAIPGLKRFKSNK